MLNVKDIYWAAGIIEGEGCFQAENNKYPRIRVGMVDKDVIYKLHSIIGGKLSEVGGHGGRTHYILNLYGNIALQWMLTLYSLMCGRRKRKIREILELWKVADFPGKGRTLANGYIR